jgi:predicted MFS family arabinose efflux permease
MPLAGRATSRFGSRRVMRAGLVAFCAAAALTPVAPSLALLCVACVAFGASNGALDVSMNAHGVAVEARAGRPILSSFHAAFSLGGLIGALVGAAGAGADIDVRVQLAALALAGSAIGLFVTRALLPADADRRPAAEPRGRIGLDRGLALLGVVAFSCLLCEGAAADWSAVYLDRSLAASPAVAGLAYAAFSVAMVSGRLAGDALTARLGPVRLVRRGALLSAAGIALALVLATPAAALAGFACLGAGLSIVVPQVFRAAAASGDTGPALARVSTLGYTGFLAGPPVIGALSEAASLPLSLALLPLLGLVVAVLAPLTRVPG